MRSSDIAYMAALVDADKKVYPGKQLLLEELQRAWKAVSSLRTEKIRIEVSTSWAEEEAMEKERRGKKNKP